MLPLADEVFGSFDVCSGSTRNTSAIPRASPADGLAGTLNDLK